MAKARSSSISPNWVIVSVFFVAGAFFGGLGIYLLNAASQTGQIKYHLSPGAYKYTNPTLVSEPSVSGDSSSVNTDLQLSVQSLLTRAKTRGGVTDAGVYFRDLEAGTWLAVNADAQFSPGYQIKLPILITYYKLAEQNPAILKETVTYTRTTTGQEDVFSSGSPLTLGATYTVEDLLSRMIVQSDDVATILLYRHVDKNLLNEIYSDLGVNFIEDEATRDYISLRRYAFFFRVLYNATYLTPDYSEKALALIAQSPSASLLEMQTPHSVSFVSRLGGRTFVSQGIPSKEVYECDVVYYPQHDYLLCAFARAKSLTGITSFFSDLGAAIYNNTQYHYPQ